MFNKWLIIITMVISLVIADNFCNKNYNTSDNINIIHYFKENNKTLSAYLMPTNIRDFIYPEEKIMFIVHGWRDWFNQSYFVELVEAILIFKPEYKVFMIDWHSLASTEYLYAAQVNTIEVGKYLTFLCIEMNTFSIDLKDITIMGHSLGAQIAGLTGKNLKECLSKEKLGRIVALDPAGPTFNGILRDRRLFKEDAEDVIVLHTNDRFLGNGEVIGTVDFYPNDGMNQPHCRNTVTEITGLCSHISSVNYMTEAITRNEFLASEIFCSNVFVFRNCEDGMRILKFNLDIPTGTSGSFKFCTNLEPPFGTGHICNTQKEPSRNED